MTKKEAIEQAQNAFWESIAKNNPASTAKDLPVLTAHEFDKACTKAVNIWLENNQPYDTFNVG